MTPCKDPELEKGVIKGVQLYEYFIFNKQGNSNDKVRKRMNKDRKATGALNSLLQNIGIEKDMMDKVERKHSSVRTHKTNGTTSMPKKNTGMDSGRIKKEKNTKKKLEE
ncbi:hypothetical protein HUJ04_003172 [Dendroctonus ponderosae]|nr:hypothetical protein HUJ04_003172 [Dendroctonus ponderosae]